MASIMARVYLSLMREPTPYEPPVHPVFTSQAVTSCFLIFSASPLIYEPAS
jgi:hypothetical protein